MKIEDYTLKLDSDIVPWRLVEPTGANKQYCVLWLQGWGSSMDSHLEGIGRMAKKTGTSFAALDYAGHGVHHQPLDTSTREQQLGEVVAVFDQLKKHGYKNVIVIGGSFGGYMAALLTAKRPVHAAVLRAPGSYPDNELSTPFAKTEASTDPESHHNNRAKPNYLSNSAVSAIKNYGGFVYILEHELDLVIDPKIPKTYFEAAKHGNYIIIPKTGHSPKIMAEPAKHYAYIEHIIISVIEAIKLADTLS